MRKLLVLGGLLIITAAIYAGPGNKESYPLRYGAICRNDFEQFLFSVNKYMDEGWQLQGGMSVDCSRTMQDDCKYCQALRR